MSLPARKRRNFRKISGVRLRPELVEALPPAAQTTAVAQVMEPMTESIDLRADLLEALRLFVDRGVHAVSVVGSGGEPVGVLSKTDVLGELCEEQHGVRRDLPASVPEAAAELEARASVRVHDIMTPLTVAVSEWTSLAHAIAVMARSGVHPVPVTTDDGRVTGVLSSADVLRWLARNGVYG
jgi:predicted transcriptional regulator